VYALIMRLFALLTFYRSGSGSVGSCSNNPFLFFCVQYLGCMLLECSEISNVRKWTTSKNRDFGGSLAAAVDKFAFL
jgi:hypothetical protein